MCVPQSLDIYSSKAKRIRANRWRKGLDHEDGEKVWAERFKTKMCKNYEDQGHCPYESRCMFAHGEHDLRTAKQNLKDGLVSERAIREWRTRDSDVMSRHSDSTSSDDVAVKPAVASTKAASYPSQVAMSWKAIVAQNSPKKILQEAVAAVAQSPAASPQCLVSPQSYTSESSSDSYGFAPCAAGAYQVILPSELPPSVMVTKMVDSPQGPKQVQVMRREPYSWAAIPAEFC